MKTILLLASLALLAGCAAEKPAATADAAKTDTAASATLASGPNSIALTNQKKVWQCPNCGMQFDGPGECSMGDGELVEMNVEYICPADDKPVDQAGKCPRCAANAKVVTTAVAVAVPPVLSGK